MDDQEIFNHTNEEAREAHQAAITAKIYQNYPNQTEALDEIHAFLAKMSKLGVHATVFSGFQNEKSKINGMTAVSLGNGGDFLKWEKGQLTKETKLDTITRNHITALGVGLWASSLGYGDCLFEKGANGFVHVFHQACVWADEGKAPDEYIELSEDR